MISSCFSNTVKSASLAGIVKRLAFVIAGAAVAAVAAAAAAELSVEDHLARCLAGSASTLLKNILEAAKRSVVLGRVK
jgi:hypothetical protein